MGRALRTAGRSPATISSYAAGVRAFATWAAEHVPDLDKLMDVEPTHLRSWLAGMTEGGAAAKSVSARYQAVRAYFDWLVAEGEVFDSPALKVQRPKPREPEVRVPTKDELRAMLGTCRDRKVFSNVRDEAVADAAASVCV